MTLDLTATLDELREELASARYLDDEDAIRAEIVRRTAALPIHPLCAIFPAMDDAELDGLVEDVRAHGLLDAIVTLDGAILDGRNRQAACLALGIVPRYEPFEGDDPLAYVVSRNLARRHLSASQRAMLAVEIRRLGAPEPEARGEARKIAGSSAGSSASGSPSARVRTLSDGSRAVVRLDSAAEAVGVSPRMVEHAARVVDAGVPELGAAVRSGAIAVAVASDIARAPVEEQRRVVDLGDEKAVRKAAREIAARDRAAKIAARAEAAIDAADGVDVPAGVEIVLGDARAAIERAADLGGAALSIVDAPWDRYREKLGVSAPEGVFPVLDLAGIAAHLALLADASLPDSRLVVWHCWPLLCEAIDDLVANGGASEWATILRPPGWRLVSGGAWTKLGPDESAAIDGVGYHWRGASELALVYVRGTPGRMAEAIPSGWASPPGAHSAKPVGWTRAWLRAWTAPGDVVCVPYLGSGGDAEACVAEGRRCVAAELSAARHAEAVLALAAIERAAK